MIDARAKAMLDAAMSSAFGGGRVVVYASAAGRADDLFTYMHALIQIRAQAHHVDMRVTMSASRRSFKLTTGGSVRVVLVQRADPNPDWDVTNKPAAVSYCDAGIDQEIRRLVVDGRASATKSSEAA